MRSYSALVANSTLSTPSRLNNRSLWSRVVRGGSCLAAHYSNLGYSISSSASALLCATSNWILGDWPVALLPLFHDLDTSSHIGDQCHPIQRILAAEEPNGFVGTRCLLVVLGLPWCIAGISLSAYMV